MDASKLWRIRETADFFGVSIRQVRNYMRRGLRVVRLGTTLRFDPADAKRFADEHKSATAHATKQFTGQDNPLSRSRPLSQDTRENLTK